MKDKKRKHEFKVSHYVTSEVSGIRVPVMLEDNGQAYDREEWDDGSEATTFTRDRDGQWFENGAIIAPDAVDPVDREIPVIDDEAAKVVGRMAMVTGYNKAVLKAIDQGEEGYSLADRNMRCLIAEAQAARCDLAPAIKARADRLAREAKERADAEKARKAAEFGATIPGVENTITPGRKKGD